MTIAGFLADEQAMEMRAYFESCPRGYSTAYSLEDVKSISGLEVSNVRLFISLIEDNQKKEEIVFESNSLLESKGFVFFGHHEDFDGVSYYFNKLS